MCSLKKYVAYFIILLCAVSTIFAETQAEMLERIITSGTKEELTKTLKKDRDLIDYVFWESRDTLLHVAVQNDREIDFLEVLLKAGISPTEKNKNRQTPIMQLCQYSHNAQALDKLILSGTIFKRGTKGRVTAKDKEDKSAIDYAIDKPEMLAVLAKYAPKEVTQALEDKRIQDELRALEEQAKAAEAAQEAEAAAAAAAIAAEEQAKAQAEAEAQLAQEAARQAAEEQQQLSLSPDLTLDLAQPDVDIGTPLPVYLFDVPEDEDTTVTLTDIEPQMTYEEANMADKNKVTLLMKAVKKGDIQTARQLIAAGAEVEAKDKDGWTALMYAARFNNNLQITRVLLAYGADRDTKNNYGLTAIQYAAMQTTNPDIILELVNHKDSPHNKEAFMYAITAERPTSIIKAFLDSDLPINDFYDGKTPLMHAAASNTHTDIILTLLQNGAIKTVKSAAGKTAYDYAQANKKLIHDDTYFLLAK